MTWNRNVRKFLSEVKNKFWSLLFMLGDISSKQTFKYTIVILYPKKQKKIGQNYSTGLKIFFKSLRKPLDQGKKASSSSFLATIAQWFCVFLMVWVFLTAPYHSSMWNSHNKLASSQWNHTHMKASHTHESILCHHYWWDLCNSVRDWCTYLLNGSQNSGRSSLHAHQH